MPADAAPDHFVSLARKWRPRTLADMVGQEYVVRALQNAARDNRLHHALLFSGTRGIGKTTLARIVAMLINCNEGGSEPCLKCDFCRDIIAGRMTDVIEQDAASHTQVDKMRELLESAVYAPARARYKVFIIDEVHMLTRQSFNAMLKTLEEPPAHVKFILATTDPQKLPATVRSRCLCFSLQPLTVAQISDRLAHILGEEKIPYTEAATAAVARLASGSMRDALSILDQAVAHTEGELQADDVRRITGDIGVDMLADILRAVAGNDAAQISAITAAHVEQHVSFELSLGRIAALTHKIALAQVLGEQAPQESDADEAAVIAEMAPRFTAEQLQVLYEIAIRARQQLPLAPDGATGFAMALLRMTLFSPAAGGGGAAPAGGAGGGASVGGGAAATNTNIRAAAATAAPAFAEADQPYAPPLSPPPAAAAAPPVQIDPAATAAWRKTSEKIDSIAGALAMYCVAERYDSSGVRLVLDKEQEALAERFLPQLKEALQQLHGAAFNVELIVGAGNAAHDARQADMIARAQQSPFTRSVMAAFPNATLREDSVRPTEH